MDLFNILKINFRDFAIYRVKTLIFLTIGISFIFLTFLNPLLNDLFQTNVIGIITWGVLELIIIVYWYYVRTIFPKVRSKKKNIVIAITSEDDESEKRLKKDFSTRIKKQLKIYGLSDQYDIVVLHDYLSIKAKKIIDSYSDKNRDKQSIKELFDLSYRLNASFFVYGDMMKRNSSGNETYFLDIEALILHSNSNPDVSKAIMNDFNNLWKREITFLEEDELNGFRDNAENVFFTATYMIGLATFSYNSYEKALNIWNKLERFIRENKGMEKHAPRINQLKLASLVLAARFCHINGEIEKSIEYRRQHLEISPNVYNNHLNESIRCVIQKKYDLALKHIEKASEFSEGEGTWRYNKLYILLRKKENKKALEVLDEILANKYKLEIEDTLEQVMAYNYNQLIVEPEFIQAHFILGVLIFKKMNKPILAYDDLNYFVERAKEDESLILIRERAQNYLEEIDKIINVEPKQ
ncbi:hypothetical protein KO566_00765 [Flavobacteriaceae bacterium XHP0103]|uniref:hypothetical protein n=1 Tax=Marixanthotalea marina TaxID=2844359 RepID=UPI002989D93D|nr:hypothetical protein [Marixanthotalea marina]MBU3820576.1 hypothetical protein [Marixanthotalea marina]